MLCNMFAGLKKVCTFASAIEKQTIVKTKRETNGCNSNEFFERF